jgi:hypothetical protein
LINPHTLTDLLQTIADWRDELQTKTDSARHTVSPKLFKLLVAEVKTFRRVYDALADSFKDKK